MTRLEAIASRRSALLREAEVTRESLRLTANRARTWVTPISIGIAAGQAVVGRGWTRVAALVSVGMLLLRRWRGG